MAQTRLPRVPAQIDAAAAADAAAMPTAASAAATRPGALSLPAARRFGGGDAAASRYRADGGATGPSQRPYPPAPGPDDTMGNAAVFAALHALQTVQTRAETALILRTAVNDLGGVLVPARMARPDAIAVDLSLGIGEPKYAWADELSLGAMRLAHHLPNLVHAAFSAAQRCDEATLEQISLVTPLSPPVA